MTAMYKISNVQNPTYAYCHKYLRTPKNTPQPSNSHPKDFIFNVVLCNKLFLGNSTLTSIHQR